jgi:hypothetical protein
MSEYGPIIPCMSNYVNGVSGEQVIHRYCYLPEMYGMLENRLTLKCPFEWDDPFENPLFRCKLTNADGTEIDLHTEGKKLRCQCWTLNHESRMRFHQAEPRG